MSSPLLETERTYLRPFRPEDADGLFELHQAEEISRFTKDRPFPDREAALEFITHYDHYQKYGLGRWAVIHKGNEEFLGWCGLHYDPGSRKIDLGYRLIKRFWGQGLASETARAVLDHAFDQMHYPVLWAHAHVDNVASQRILEKLGFQKKMQRSDEGVPIFTYRIANPDYAFKRISALETYPVRHPVLREGQPYEKARMEADDLDTTTHYGAYYQDQLVGVATLMLDTHPDFKGEQCRLRGMAVLPEFRKRGIAEMLLQLGIEDYVQKGCDLLWFNARIGAVSFYQKLSFEIHGELFDIPDIGAHYVMKKTIP
ncbi:GNAT family N-acetyltransferase [Croceiramulus getboli]|nr:GNAT family N-acetyltransferase [Flavobacteriaceae bacterium YJPT1-3]